MDEQYYVKSLKRLYDEAEKSQQREDYQAINAIIKTHNQLLPEIKDQFPNNDVIQSIEEVDFQETYKGVSYKNIRELQTVKMRALQMADALGMEVENFEKQASKEGMTLIQVNQSVAQTVDASFTGVTQLINNLPRDEGDKEQLRELVKKFQEEVQSEQPDESTIRSLIDEAREYSKDVAVKLALAGLNKGIDLLA